MRAPSSIAGEPEEHGRFGGFEGDAGDGECFNYGPYPVSVSENQNPYAPEWTFIAERNTIAELRGRMIADSP